GRAGPWNRRRRAAERARLRRRPARRGRAGSTPGTARAHGGERPGTRRPRIQGSRTAVGSTEAAKERRCRLCRPRAGSENEELDAAGDVELDARNVGGEVGAEE